jgi:hypothetical protein
MSRADPMGNPAAQSVSAEAAACDPARLLRMSRGFACLFWSLPLLSAAHAMALKSWLSPRWMIGLLLASFLPLICGLWMLRAAGNLTPRWGVKIGRVSMLALVAIYLCPFLVWWSFAPTGIYFAVNAAAHYVAMIGLLAGLNRLAGESARRMDDASLRRESQAGLGMVLWLSGCTVGALAWLFHRAGLLEAGVPTVLAQLAQLPNEARYLLLLPYAMTAYVMWRAKETGFRRAVRTGI